MQFANYILSPERILLLREMLANPYIEPDQLRYRLCSVFSPVQHNAHINLAFRKIRRYIRHCPYFDQVYKSLLKFQVAQFLLIKELREPSEPLAFWGNSKISLTTSLLNTLPILNSDSDCLDQSQRILDEYHHYYLYKGLLQDS